MVGRKYYCRVLRKTYYQDDAVRLLALLDDLSISAASQKGGRSAMPQIGRVRGMYDRAATSRP
jgi:hypothetical protein